MRLSILDQSIIFHGQSSRDALDETVKTIQQAEELGYSRFWVSEHHNSKNIAGTSPEVLIPHLALQTKRIRVGSGGIMLPNHSAYKMAENFRMLETLYPGRIDLGMGRAPGGDGISARLLNPSNRFSEDDYIKQLDYLQHFFNDTVGTSQGKVVAMPRPDNPPQQWILSSSGGSTAIAAKFGMGLAVAKFINGNAHPAMVEAYKRAFKPSEEMQKPAVILSIIALCGDTKETAAAMRKFVDFIFLQMAKGVMDLKWNEDEIMAYVFSPQELAIVASNNGRVVSGTKEEVKAQLDQLAQQFDADEIMVTNMAGQLELRQRSFELLAEAYELQ